MSSSSGTPRKLFSTPPYWAVRFGNAPFLPTSRAEMEALGWDSCDVILVTGDAYVDHPSFGMSIIGRLLESQGFRVGIIAQPDWRDVAPFQVLGRPNLFFGVTSGNMDSMVNHYTSDRKRRHNDAYTPDDEAGRRPDRAVIIYSQRLREAFRTVPILLGGIEASLRRIAHYDYWSDTVRRSILPDSKADLLVYGNGERAIVEIAHRAARGIPLKEMHDIRGTSFMRHPHDSLPEGWIEVDATLSLPRASSHDRDTTVLRLPAFEQVRTDRRLYAHASHLMHQETNPGNARALVQRHGERDVWVTPPPFPLTSDELDRVFALPFARVPHPRYGTSRLAAYEMIRFSVNILRGCFGGCAFCSITEHEGRIIQSRSDASILGEIEAIRDKTPGFTGVISDLGGPTANMFRLSCTSPQVQRQCRRPSCVHPDICPRLDTDHSPLIALYRKARALPGIKKILIASGVRYDLAVRDPAYVTELATHHVGGYLKIAPEHTEPGPLSKMLKPGIASYERFKLLFDKASKAAGKEQYLIPYFIAAHPGTTDEDMLHLALWLKRNGYRVDQVQAFLPSPMALASAMYHTGLNPLTGALRDDAETVFTIKKMKHRQLHKAFLRYHDAENWPLLRTALQALGRADLIGNGKHQLVPAWQPAGTGRNGGEGRRLGRKHGVQHFLTQGNGLPRPPKRQPS